MSERSVTAVVLLSQRETATHHRETFAALAAQTRRPDRVVVVAPADLPEGTEAVVDAAFDAGGIDELLRTSSSLGFAGAVRHVIDLLSDPERITPDPTPQPESATSGRRARDIDVDQEAERVLRRAESLARVPERLREETGAPGRRGSGRRRAGADGSWLWFVTEECAPGARALEELLDAVAVAPATAVAGPKRLRHRTQQPSPDQLLTADDADGLVDVGLTLTHGGRIHTGVEPGEVDQGQLDWREDVLAVALPGMLVRESTLVGVGGFDPMLSSPWTEIDLCHRVWRGGERVAVVPEARVVEPPPTESGPERLREHRRSQMLSLIKERPLLYAVIFLLLTPVLLIGRVAGAIIMHSPRIAQAELLAWVGMIARVPRAMTAGAAVTLRSPVPRRRLAPLYLPRGEDLRQQLDSLWTRFFADDDRTRRIRRTTWGISGTSHGADDADYGRHGVWTLGLAVGIAVITLVAMRSLIGRGDLVGPSLIPLAADWRVTAQSAWSSWVTGSLGARGPADPLLRLLGSIPVPGTLLVEVIVFASIPISGLAAWWAAGALTRAVGARLAIAVVWASAPSLLSALSSGLWQALIVHMLLPLLALAVGRAIGLPHRVSQASVSAAAAAGLVLLVIGAVQPVLLLVAAVALALLAPAVPGRRRRLLWVVIPSLALHLPFIPQYVMHPATLLAGPPGVAPGQQSGLTVLSLWPSAPPAWQLLAPIFGQDAAAMVPVLLLVPVALAAVISPFLARSAGHAGRLAVLLAAIALALAALAARTTVGIADGLRLAADQHGLMSIALLAILLGAGCTFDALARRGPGISRARRALSLTAAWGIATVCLVLVVGWSIGLPAVLGIHRDSTVEVPAAAADSGQSVDRKRVLVLEADGPDDVQARLVVGGGDVLSQHSGFTEAREIEAIGEEGVLDTDPGSDALRSVVSELLGSTPAGSEESISLLGIEYVVVPGAVEDQAELVGALDGSPLVEKVTQTSSGGLWRLVDAAPRVWIGEPTTMTEVAEDGTEATSLTAVPIGEEPQAIPSRVIDARGEVEASDEERVLVLSERYDTRWQAHLDGQELEPVTLDGWAQGFLVPADLAGEVTVEREQVLSGPARILLLATVVITALIAVPWRRRPVEKDGARWEMTP